MKVILILLSSKSYRYYYLSEKVVSLIIITRLCKTGFRFSLVIDYDVVSFSVLHAVCLGNEKLLEEKVEICCSFGLWQIFTFICYQHFQNLWMVLQKLSSLWSNLCVGSSAPILFSIFKVSQISTKYRFLIPESDTISVAPCFVCQMMYVSQTIIYGTRL